MDTEHQIPDDSGRRAFKPPRQRRRRPRRPASVQRDFSLWDLREGFGYGLIRALCAVGFGFVPSFDARFGDASLAVVSSGLAMFVFAIVLLLLHAGRPAEWPLLADAVSLLVLVPVIITASGIEVSDARLGGRSTNFLAAAGAVILVYLIVVVIATRGGADRTASSQVGVLPGSLSIAIILLGTEHFSAGAIWRGLSIAWMVAAIATVTAMFVSMRARLFVAPAAFALVAIGVVVPDFLGDSERSLSSGSSGIAVLSTAVVASVLVLIPLRPRSPTSRPAPPVD